MKFFGRVEQPDHKELVKLVDDHTGIISGMNKRIGDLELELTKLRSHLVSLRGFVNRKFESEEPGEEFKSKESIDGLDSLRK